MKSMDQLANTRRREPSANWPRNDWWKSYGDAQIDPVDEALRDSPNLAIAQARLRQAGAVARWPAHRSAGVTANAPQPGQAELKLPLATPPVPSGWKDYGVATLISPGNWTSGVRTALPGGGGSRKQQAVPGRSGANPLILSASMASAYAELLHLFTVRDLPSRH